MAITIDLPQQMVEEAEGYATLQGTTLEQMFLAFLKKELSCAQVRQSRVAQFRARLMNQTRRTGASYKFNRQDAYEEDLG